MHPAPYYRETGEAALSALVAERGFGLVVGVQDGRPLVAHTAFLLDERRLRFHLAARNALTPVFEAGGKCLAVVTGPDAYVSPDWYGEPDRVPTWDYVSVEMEGPVAPLDAAGARVLLDDLSAHFEARLAPKTPWTRDKMSAERFDLLLTRGLRAFEMRVERLEGTTKLSQDKAPEAVARTADALAALADPGAQAIARLMREPRRRG